jgi:hypothetical protein
MNKLSVIFMSLKSRSLGCIINFQTFPETFFEISVHSHESGVKLRPMAADSPIQMISLHSRKLNLIIMWKQTLLRQSLHSIL